MTEEKWTDVVDMVQQAAAEHHTKRPLREQIDGHKERITDREEAKRKKKKRQRCATPPWKQRGKNRGGVATELKCLDQNRAEDPKKVATVLTVSAGSTTD